MECFDKRMALDVIEDALNDLETPHNCGMATGLCGAFYMCGLLSTEEWEALLKRIPASHDMDGIEGLFEIGGHGRRGSERMLN